MLNNNEIFETIRMIDSQNLDVRTITMSLSLFDCISRSPKETAERVYDKIYTRAKNIVAVGEEIAGEYGVPIVNKRVSVTPISLIGAASGGYKEIAFAMDKVAEEIGIDFIGGYGALVHKSTTPYEADFLETIPSVLASTKKVCSAINVGSTKSGINMDAVAVMGKKIKELAALTADSDSIGCAKLVVFCNAVEDNREYSSAYSCRNRRRPSRQRIRRCRFPAKCPSEPGRQFRPESRFFEYFLIQ